MIIAVGTDHRGFMLKEHIKEQLSDEHTIVDHGTHSQERTDYPPFAHAVVTSLLTNQADVGILLCGSGTGMAIAANRFAGIYAAVVWSPEVAQAAKQDDNCNILVVPADFISAQTMMDAIQAWLQASFKAGRYQDRLEMVDHLG